MSKISKCEETIVHQLLELDAKISVKPIIEHGQPRVFCVDADITKLKSKSTKPGKSHQQIWKPKMARDFEKIVSNKNYFIPPFPCEKKHAHKCTFQIKK